MIEHILLVPSILLCYMIFLVICKKQYSACEIILGIFFSYAVVLAVVIVLNYISIPMLSSDVFGNLALTGCLFLFARRRIKKTLLNWFFVLFTMVVAMIGNTALGVVLEVCFSLTTSAIRESIIWYSVMGLLTFPICYALSKFIGDNLHVNYTKLPVVTRNKFATHGFALAACAYVLAQLNIFVYRFIDDRILLSSINVLMIVSMFSVAFITMITYSRSQQAILEMEFKEKSLKDLGDHYHQLETAYDEMRKYKHDHMQLLASMVGFADGKNLNEFKAFLADNLEYAKDVLDKLDDSMDKLKFIHLPELRGLLSIKFAQALSRDVKVKLDFAKSVTDIPINRMDLSRMVGIIVDNAIEELDSKEYLVKNLTFGIIHDESVIMVICVNTCDVPPDVEQIFKKNFTTKEPGRGLGLFNLREMCESNGNVVCTVYHENNEFTVILTIGWV